MSDLDFSKLSPDELEKALEGPALQPPDGILPNFSNPPNLNNIESAGLLVCLVISGVFLLIRIYVKFFKLKQTHIADYLMILGYSCYMFVVVGTFRRMSNATGVFVHQWDMRGRDMKGYLQAIFLGMILWVAGILLVKASILIEWGRIFAPARTRSFFFFSYRILLYFTIIFYMSAITSLLLTCTPFRRIWDKTVPGSCINLKRINLTIAIVNLLLNIAILLLPQTVIWGLQISKAQKAGLSMMFAVGLASCGAAIALLEAIIGWIQSDDMTYYYSGVGLWGVAELTCGFLVFSVPSAPKAFRDVKPTRWFLELQSLAGSSVKRLMGSPRQSSNWPRPVLGSQKPREYEAIEERGSIRLRDITSPRPTDQQYGIVCTTDIVVTETYDDNRPIDHTLPYPWNNRG